MERNENGYSSYNLSQNNCGCARGGLSGGNNGGAVMDDGGMNNSHSSMDGGASFENGNGARKGTERCIGTAPRLAIAYVPMQQWRMLYAPDNALARGTMFEELDMPLEDCTNG